MGNTKASFVIPSYNCAEWLPHAVNSCLAQTHSDIEVVIVDDGSTDTTQEYLSWIKKKDKRVISPNFLGRLGRGRARNLGNKFASGEVLFVLDADDYAHPNRVKLTLDKIKRGAEFVYGDAEVMDPLGKTIGIKKADVFNLEKAKQPPYWNRIFHSTVAYTQRLAIKFLYSEEKEVSDLGIDDWKQQIEMALAGVKFEFIPSTLSAYREMEGSVTGQRNIDKVNDYKKKFFDSLRVAA